MATGGHTWYEPRTTSNLGVGRISVGSYLPHQTLSDEDVLLFPTYPPSSSFLKNFSNLDPRSFSSNRQDAASPTSQQQTNNKKATPRKRKRPRREESNDKPGETRKKKRSQVSFACDYCRKKHNRCNEIKPCVECLKRGKPCICSPTAGRMKRYMEIGERDVRKKLDSWQRSVKLKPFLHPKDPDPPLLSRLPFIVHHPYSFSTSNFFPLKKQRVM